MLQKKLVSEFYELDEFHKLSIKQINQRKLRGDGGVIS